MDWTIFFSLVGGAAAALFGAYTTHRQVRSEREAAGAERRQEREEVRRDAERERVADLYKRVSLIAREYRALEDSADRLARWKIFEPRLHEVQAELDIHGTPAVRKAFVEYLNYVQERQHELDQMNIPSEWWIHHDEAMDGLLAAMRDDWNERFARAATAAAEIADADSRKKSLRTAQQAALPAPKTTGEKT